MAKFLCKCNYFIGPLDSVAKNPIASLQALEYDLAVIAKPTNVYRC
jgi:hypothetical protein